MERFFFDVDDGKRQVRDAIGKELHDREAAVLEAGSLLRSLAVIRSIEGRPGDTFVMVRDAQGAIVYAASTGPAGE